MSRGPTPIDQTFGMLDDGWEPIAVRAEGDAVRGEADERPQRAKNVRHLAVASDPIIGPGPTVEDEASCTLPRLARHEITLPDGHQVGVAICGHGVPLVVVHGFSAEGILYAQTLSRLVDLGFKVIAVDTAGHGGTLGPAHQCAEHGELRRAPGSGARSPGRPGGGAGRPLDGRSAGHRAGRHASPIGPSP